MKKIHPVALGNALIWTAAILAAAALLRGADQATLVLAILGGAAGGSIITVSNALRKDESQ
jgi:hypothetical protein